MRAKALVVALLLALWPSAGWGAATPTYTGSVVVPNGGTITLQGLAGGGNLCLQVNNSGVIITAAAACPAGSGGAVLLSATNSGYILAGSNSPTGIGTGDLGSGSTAACGRIRLGGASSTGVLDYGCTTAGQFTMNPAQTTTLLYTATLPSVLAAFSSSCAYGTTCGIEQSVANGVQAITVNSTGWTCTTVGTGGTYTYQWYYNTAADPHTGSWTAITGATANFTTAGGSPLPSNTFTPVNLSGLSANWVRVEVTAVGSTAAGCSFFLGGTQQIP